MTRFDAKFKIWGNSMEVTVFADSRCEALLALERRYAFIDEGTLSVVEEKEDSRQMSTVIYS